MTSHLRAAILVNLVVMAAISRPALAADASPWDGDQRAAVRLIGAAQRGTVHAGVEIRLASGWKTYWRYPGDSGVPPRFDFSASRNVASVTVRYPAPQRLSDESGTSIGYKTGPQFFRGLRGSGLSQAALTLILCGSGLATAYAVSRLLGFDAGRYDPIVDAPED